MRLWVLLLVGSCQADRFIWWSDIHYNPQGHRIGKGFDTPSDLFQSALSRASNLTANFWLVTGDSVHHGVSSTGEAQNVLLKVSQELRAATELPIIPCVGNNDVYPDYQGVHNPNLYSNLKTAWRPFFANRTTTSGNLTTQGHLSINVQENLKIVSINTLWYTTRQMLVNQSLTQMDWLRNELAAARLQQQYVWVVGHIPPTIGSYRHEQQWFQGFLQTYFSLVKEYADVVQAQLFGHFHSQEFRLYQDNLLWLAPSLTPIHGNHPAFLVVDYNAEKGTLEDFVTHYFNGTDWTISESFRKAFHVPDMNVASAKTALSQWEIIRQRQSVHIDPPALCGDCFEEYQCAVTTTTRFEYQACLQSSGKAGSAMNLDRPMTIGGSIVIGLFFVMVGYYVVRWCRQRRRHQGMTPIETNGEMA